MSASAARDREREYYEALYSGFAQSHFSRPAVVAFREHLVERILCAAAAGRSSRVLSIGCGIGDAELLLAPHVGEIVGVDPVGAAIAEAQAAALRRQVRNVSFRWAAWESLDESAGVFDIALSVFVLHHLPADELRAAPDRVKRLLRPGGVFYALEPSARRLSGAVGALLLPRLMKKFQTPDERQLHRDAVAGAFAASGYAVRAGWYDFCSTPIAGLFPGWRSLYRLARLADNALVSIPGIRALGSNFELVATRPQ
jgi:SAM-dependent methyltransferase